ncbi:MAG: hypothetical protein SGI73_11010 [Chloroflexota bacterium]|nr:hypothetical protein [Chloroflexota bacterium]
MEFLGVGGMELIAFLLIALIVAGPKQMIQWAYQAGKWVNKAKAMWSETAAMLQKEFDKEGIDFKVPTEPPTRQSLNNEIKRFTNPISKPLQDTFSSVKSDIDNVKTDVNGVRETAAAVSTRAAKPAAKPASASVPPPTPTTNGSAPVASPTVNDAPASTTPGGETPDGGYGTWSG